MIVNKAALGGALSICYADKDYPQLDCVCIEPDGTIVAINKHCIYCAEPVLASVVSRLPFTKFGAPSVRVVLSSSAAIKLYKAIVVDRTFKGLLEHASLDVGAGGAIGCELRDGKGTHALNLRALRSEYFDWKKSLDGTSHPAVGHQTVYNRKRLNYAVQAVESACKYDGSFAPVFVEHTGAGVLWRAINELTGQRVLILFKDSKIKQEWPALTPWEHSVLAPKPIRRFFKQGVSSR